MTTSVRCSVRVFIRVRSYFVIEQIVDVEDGEVRGVIKILQRDRNAIAMMKVQGEEFARTR